MQGQPLPLQTLPPPKRIYPAPKVLKLRNPEQNLWTNASSSLWTGDKIGHPDLASDPKSSVSYNGISLLKATHEYVAPCLCFFLLSFLMMKAHHLSRSKHTRHFPKWVTTLSSNSNLILMITLCGIYHDDLHFTHQETEALSGYINFPTMKWQNQDSALLAIACY